MGLYTVEHDDNFTVHTNPELLRHEVKLRVKEKLELMKGSCGIMSMIAQKHILHYILTIFYWMSVV